MSSSGQPKLSELATFFLRLGASAFGGPAAHLAMMEAELVRERQWLTHEQFLDLMSVCNLLPGPNSTEMAIHIGFLRNGWAGLIVAGLCFITPAALIVSAIAYCYVQWSNLPQFTAILYGVKPVVIAVVFQALCSLGPKAVNARSTVLIAAAAGLLYFFGVNELLVLFGSGAIAGFIKYFSDRSKHSIHSIQPLCWLLVITLLTFLFSLYLRKIGTAPQAFDMTRLFWYFAKIGSVLYGSGYVLLAFLRADLVDHWHWLTDTQLLDAIAVGQMTPGPLFTTATFIGYLLAGPAGAFLATVGIFMPAFFFIAFSGPISRRLRSSPVAVSFLSGLNAASYALMFVVTIRLLPDALPDLLAILITIAAAILVVGARVNSSILVACGALTGLARQLIFMR
jgi:chromate transporter